MIGQKKLLAEIKALIDKECFPRFSIIVGSGRCGKRTVAAYIANLLSDQPGISRLIKLDGKIESIREAINLSYKQSEPTIYLIPDADRISISAKNALLKITEEPPRKAYFIMTLQNQENTLETLRSRGSIFHIDPYTYKELRSFIKQLTSLEELGEERVDKILQICLCPGDIQQILAYEDILPLYKYALTVVTSIGKASGANAFKIGSKLAYKEEDTGWNCTLFLRAVMAIFEDFLVAEKASAKSCYESLKVVSKGISDLELSGVNKAATIDIMILDLRKIWVNVDD